MSRFSPQQPDRLPKTAKEYRDWFAEEVERVRHIPLEKYYVNPKTVISSWQREGLRLIQAEEAEKKRKALLLDWGL